MAIAPYTISMSPQRFIADLIPIILESDDHWWPRDLFRLSLVSVAWVGPVRRRLYACPSVHSFKACYRLARSFKENPALLTPLRGLDLRPVSEELSSRLGEKEMASLRYLLCMDGIKTLTLGGELAVQAERFLHSLGHPEHIAELHIEGNLTDRGCSYLHYSKPASLEWDEVIAFRFPGLRTLKLSNLELDVISPSLHYELGITDLICNNVHVVSGYFHNILNGSWSSLRHLSVTTATALDFNSHMNLMLYFCAPTLQTLRYQTMDDSAATDVLQSRAETYPSLRRLYLSGMAVDYETLSLVGRRCRNLEELSIVGRSIHMTMEEWVAFIRSDAPSSLRRLLVPGGTCCPPFEVWSADTEKRIVKACAERTIQVIYPAMPRNHHSSYQVISHTPLV